MKKLLALILAIALMASLPLTAFATNTEGGQLEVSFEVNPSYIVTIPSTVELAKKTTDGVTTYENDYTITTEPGVRLHKGDTIVVTVSSDYVMDAQQGATLPYTITKGGAALENNVVATFSTNTAAQSSMIHITATDPTYAGNYSDTVTFTISVKKPTATPTTISFTIDGVTYQAEEGMTWAQWAVSSYNNDGEHFLSEYGWIGHVGGCSLLEDANSVITDGYETFCLG